MLIKRDLLFVEMNEHSFEYMDNENNDNIRYEKILLLPVKENESQVQNFYNNINAFFYKNTRLKFCLKIRTS